jgi:hypothetical protein
LIWQIEFHSKPAQGDDLGILVLLQSTFGSETALEGIHAFPHVSGRQLHRGIVIRSSRVGELIETVG